MTHKTGIDTRFKVVAAIIPRKTVVPTETRPAPQHNAQDKRKGRL